MSSNCCSASGGNFACQGLEALKTPPAFEVASTFTGAKTRKAVGTKGPTGVSESRAFNKASMKAVACGRGGLLTFAAA